jgi:hypothetical protein
LLILCCRRLSVLLPVELGLKLFQTAHLGHTYQVEIWDIPASTNQEEFLRDAYLSQMDGAMIVTDSTDLKSFQHIRKWADLFQDEHLSRLSDNLAAMGTEDETAHALPGLDGKSVPVSTFPVILFANKVDSDKCTLTRQDILESASHFKLSYGALGSALVNKPLTANGGAAIPPSANVSPAVAHCAAQLASLSPHDSAVDQSFHLLLGELLRFQHFRAVTPALAGAHNLGPQGRRVLKQDGTGSAGVGRLGGVNFNDSLLHSNAKGGAFGELGVASRRALQSGPAVPLPASLASIRQKSTTTQRSGGGRAAFTFDSSPPLAPASSSAASTPLPPKSLLAAAAQQRLQEEEEEGEKQQLQAQAEAAEEDDDDDEDEEEEDDEEDDDDDESEDDDDDDDAEESASSESAEGSASGGNEDAEEGEEDAK